MKKFLLSAFVICFTMTANSQISSFNIAKKKAFVYLGFTPGFEGDRGYGSEGFRNQWSDWLRVGVHYPIWKGLNVNAGISAPLNMESTEDYGITSSEAFSIVRAYQGDDFTYQAESYINQLSGVRLNAGVSYNLGLGALSIIPGVGLSAGSGNEVGLYYNNELSIYYNQTVVYSSSPFIIADAYFSLDVAYQNFMLGILFNATFHNNRELVGFRIGYGLPLKSKTKMNF
ncbi:MAG: Uncharacterised protein [Owenweeksia sp. TMED14]|nr:MAG: Uncharacterised protein [Owenweeksia sp. TMED14]